MNDLDYEFMLTDRIAKIQAINDQYDLEHNAYISFSGGKDSVVLSHLVDVALPGNTIPRIFINTGVEYTALVKYVKDLSETDSRVQIVNSGVKIPIMLRKYGYPFKSKQHAHNWIVYYNNREESNKYFEEVKKNPSLLENYDYIHNLPTGIKTNIKYVFGIREKVSPIRCPDGSQDKDNLYVYQKLP